MKKHCGVIVKWRDSAMLPGWQPMHSHAHAAAVVNTVGWMVRETPRDITITSSISDNCSVMDALTIPRESIVRIKRLKEAVVEYR